MAVLHRETLRAPVFFLVVLALAAPTGLGIRTAITKVEATTKVEVGHQLEVVHNHTGGVSSDDPVHVEHQSWFSRMADSLKGVVIGCILITFSIPILWVNERRNARLESLIDVGERSCQTVTADEADEANRGCLVHLNSADATANGLVEDDRFEDVKSDGECLRIRSLVEVYQWTEKSETKESKDSVGGGKTTTTTYSYERRWSDQRTDSSTFHCGQAEKTQYVNSFPVDGLLLGMRCKTSTDVRYGDAFSVPAEMVRQLENFKNVVDEPDNPLKLGNTLTFGDFSLQKEGDYYIRTKLVGKNLDYSRQPEIGDTRVKIEYVPNGPATVIGLQVPMSARKSGLVASPQTPKLADSEGTGKDSRDSFYPYRMISRGWCGINEAVQKERQIEEGRKSANELYQADACHCGPLTICCCCCLCACNLVALCFSGLAPPQVFGMYPGHISAKQCWEDVKKQGTASKWGFRLLGWLLMLTGTYMLFQPLFVALDVIPFVGPYLGDFAGYVVYAACFICTLLVSMVIVALAYAVYHPLVTIMYLAVVAVLVGAMGFAAVAMGACTGGNAASAICRFAPQKQ